MKKSLFLFCIALAVSFSVKAEEIELGNATEASSGSTDGWNANMCLLLGEHLYINESGGAQNIEIGDYSFYAKSGAKNPITPVVTKFMAIEDTTADYKIVPVVLAYGTTRMPTDDYTEDSENIFGFSDDETVSVRLEDGEVLAVGYIDALPDGTKDDEVSSVVTWVADATLPVWYCGGPDAAENSAKLTVGEEVDTANTTVLVLNRKYDFKMSIVTSVATPVKRYSNEIDFKVSPTIISNGSFQIDHELSSNVAIKLYDMSGRNVLTEILNQSSIRVSVNSLNSGVYFLSATVNGELVNTKKIIIQ